MRAAIALIIFLVAASAQAATPSPDGTRVPPGNEIIDAQGQSWKMERKVYVEPWNGPSAPNVLDKVEVLAICSSVVYARTLNGQWYKGVVAKDWIPIGTTDPCPVK